jgi:hypothetical protein
VSVLENKAGTESFKKLLKLIQDQNEILHRAYDLIHDFVPNKNRAEWDRDLCELWKKMPEVKSEDRKN